MCDVIMEMILLSVHVDGSNMVGKCVRAFRFGFAGTSSALCCGPLQECSFAQPTHGF